MVLPCRGQTIFLHAEQGMGDVIQFVRYVAIVVQLGGRVILEAHPPLIALMRSIPGVIQVVPYGSPPGNFDLHAPLLSLPHILGITLETIPAEVPYLGSGGVGEWGRGVGETGPILPSSDSTALKVGIVWSGNPDNPYNRTRAVPIEQLLSLADLPGIQLYNLQKDPTAADLAQLQAHPEVLDLRSQLTDFVRTAALIQQLDLVISVDTAVTHLTGALGKPVWLLLPFAPDWRWMLDRTDSPWYPTLRLFRQPKAGDWETVLGAVRQSLLEAPLTTAGKPVDATPPLPHSPQPSRPPAPAFPIALQHYEKGELLEAEQVCRGILRQQPEDLDALHTLGVILCQRQQPDEAIIHLERVVQIQANHAEAWGNLGGALQQQGKLEAAIAHYQKAIELNPNFADAHQNLSVALQGLDQLEAAVECCDRVIELKPDLPDVHYNRGYMLRRLGRLPEAIASYRRALALKPDFVTAHKNLGHALLLTGDFSQGFAEYEWRWRQPGWSPRPFSQPLWDGQPLGGKTILLHAEQGMGDTLQFIRYAQQVKQLGGQVLVECQQPLIRLLADVTAIDRLISQDTPLPHFDCHAPLLSLPHLLHTTLTTVPAEIPYLSPPPSSLAPQPSCPPATLKIGLTWTGNPSHKNNPYRSFSLEQARSLLSLPQTQFYSLQKGEAAAELQQLTEGSIVDLSPQLADFADTAAAIAQLDLVITIDTAVAHLAGAMGKPVWILLSFAPDWRWMVDRPDSPWYPTARLFRQPKAGDWGSVFAEVRAALEQEVSSRVQNVRIPWPETDRQQITVQNGFVLDSQPNPLSLVRSTESLVPTPTSDPASDPTSIALSWPVDRVSDWGLYGTNLALQLPPRFMPQVSLTESSSALDRALLQSPFSLPAGRTVMLQALGNSVLGVNSVPADRTIGVVSLEDTNLSATWLEQARSCDRLITASTWNAEVLQRHGLAAETVLWGIDSTLFHPAPKVNRFGDRFVVFAGGALTFQTAPDLVLAAFSAFQAHHPDALLLTAWRPGTIDPATLGQNLPASAVINLNLLSDLDLSQVLRSIDVALFPDRCTANLHPLALSALACGVPTILSANTGHLDLLQHNLGYGLQFQRSVQSQIGTAGWGESDGEEIVETLERIYTDRQEAQHRGAIAADFLQDWTWARQMQPLWDLLQNL